MSPNFESTRRYKINPISVMSQLKRRLKDPLYKNSFMIMLSTGISSLLGFAFWIVVARHYPLAEVGLASAMLSMLGLLYVLSSLGLHLGLIRFLPSTDDKRGVVNSCLTIAGAFSIVLAVAFILGTPIWSPDLLLISRDAGLFIAFVIFTVGYSLFFIQRYVFIALRRAELALVQQVIFAAIKLGLPLVLVSLGVLGILSSFGIGIWIALIIGSLMLVKTQSWYRPVPAVRRSVINEMVHFSLWNYVADSISSVPVTVLPLLVLGVLGAEFNAYFYMAFTITMVLNMIPIAITTSLFVEGSHDEERLRHNLMRAIRFILLLVIPVIIIIFFFGDKILLAFGKEYSENALTVLRLLSIAIIPTGFIELWVAVKRVQLQLKPIIYAYASVTILGLGASYILMSRVGLVGVGIGWLSVQGIVAIVIWLGFIKTLRSKSILNGG